SVEPAFPSGVHSRIVPFAVPAANVLPSAVAATFVTAAPASNATAAELDGRSQSFTTLSDPPDARRSPLGENESDRNWFWRTFLPASVRTSLPVAGSHSLMDLSKLPVATSLPSGDPATA